MFTLLPFFSTTNCTAKSIFSVVTQLDSFGVGMCLLNALLFLLTGVPVNRQPAAPALLLPNLPRPPFSVL